LDNIVTATNRDDFLLVNFVFSRALYKIMKNRSSLFFLAMLFIITGCSHVENKEQVIQKKENILSLYPDSLHYYDTLVEGTMIKNSRLSLRYAKRALYLASQTGKPEDLVLAYIINGISYNSNDKDSSFYYYNKALKLADSYNLIKQKTRIIYNLAMFYNQAFDYENGIKLLDSTIHLAENARDYAMMADAYNSLGMIRQLLQMNRDAKKMFDSSFRMAKKDSLYRQMGIALGNRAGFETDNNKAITLYKEALIYLGKATGTDEEIANLLINIGFRFTRPDSALIYYQEALQYAKNGNLPKSEIGAYNNMAYCYKDLKNISEAESSIIRAIKLATQINDFDWLTTLYDSYGDILVEKKDYQNAIIWQKKALVTKDSADKQQASKQVRLLGTLLDVNNKELTIQKTQTELLLQQNRLQQTRLWLAVSVLFIIVSVFVFMSIMQRNRMKLQNEQINSARRLIEMEESEKGRIARELHDITGQLIMGITGAVEKLDLPDDSNKAEIQGKIKDLGRSIRTISHRMNKAMLEHFTFKELVTGQCEDIQKLTGMQVQLDMPGDNYDLPEEMVLHSYRIIQELLTNASKYVSESTVRISFISRNDNLIMLYADNGKGFDAKELKNRGMGIMNIFERAKLLGGDAKLTSSPGNGTKWEITIPRKTNKKIPLKKVNV
jgi:signal transduction histidine kinase